MKNKIFTICAFLCVGASNCNNEQNLEIDSNKKESDNLKDGYVDPNLKNAIIAKESDSVVEMSKEKDLIEDRGHLLEKTESVSDITKKGEKGNAANDSSHQKERFSDCDSKGKSDYMNDKNDSSLNKEESNDNTNQESKNISKESSGTSKKPDFEKIVEDLRATIKSEPQLRNWELDEKVVLKRKLPDIAPIDNKSKNSTNCKILICGETMRGKTTLFNKLTGSNCTAGIKFGDGFTTKSFTIANGKGFENQITFIDTPALDNFFMEKAIYETPDMREKDLNAVLLIVDPDLNKCQTAEDLLYKISTSLGMEYIDGQVDQKIKRNLIIIAHNKDSDPNFRTNLQKNFQFTGTIIEYDYKTINEDSLIKSIIEASSKMEKFKLKINELK